MKIRIVILLCIICSVTISSAQDNSICLSYGDVLKLIDKNDGIVDSLTIPIIPERRFKFLKNLYGEIELYSNPDYSSWNQEEKGRFFGLRGLILRKKNFLIFISTVGDVCIGQTYISIYDQSLDRITLKLYFDENVNFGFSIYEYMNDDVVTEYFTPRNFDFNLKHLNTIDLCDLFELDNSVIRRKTFGAYVKKYSKNDLHREILY